MIGIIIVGTQVSGLHQELNLLKKELNYDNQIDSFNAKLESVDKMYSDTVNKLEKKLELLEKQNKELTKQLSFISSNVGDIQKKTNNKNVIEVPKVDAEKSPEELILDTIKKVAKMSKEMKRKLKLNNQ